MMNFDNEVSLATSVRGMKSVYGGAEPRLPKTKSSILHRTPFVPPTAVRADGIYVDLIDGQRLVDGVGGAAVTCIGMGNKKVIKAIKDQTEVMAYVYNAQCSNEPAEELAHMIVDNSGGAFELCGFVSGGSEAMEGVIKLARQYFYETSQPKRKNFIARKLSFHGNTVSTLALGFHPARRVPYEAIIDHENFHHVSPAYAARYQLPNETEQQYVARLAQELEDKFQQLGPQTVIGFVAETVVGATTGVVPPPKGYLKAMKEVCDRHGALFILDEVMSGMGRMGTMHGWQSYGDGVSPDIQAIAKGLGGGYASIGAVLMNKRVADGINSGSGWWQHGHTYQAHPLACVAALAVQKIIAEENLLENCMKQGEYLRKLLEERLRSRNSPAAPYIFDIRGQGGFWGIEFDIPPEKDFTQNFKLKKRFGAMLQAKTMEKGLICMAVDGGKDGTNGSHAMLAPPYNVTKEQVEEIVDLFVESVEELVTEVLH
ncbi:hypothetical protein FRB94_010664 [Tulasnella sp. JGI-2019a]|nr:hypothetical protein FRB94_010664 [Tulasnella sp. JGI-2019a]KAG9011313.1 hypothetical protein FRB93_003115 [Tulasnella sp. JGI-2019a]KAG9037402.1 hypothetical protein FRB95_005691 [Tulasnella sp. JGI-2019a]